MVEFELAMRGIAFGTATAFIGSIPAAGPISALICHRTLAGRTGQAIALLSGLVCAEVLIAMLCAWGVGYLDEFLLRWSTIAELVVVAILVVVGVYLWRQAPRSLGSDSIDDCARVDGSGFDKSAGELSLGDDHVETDQIKSGNDADANGKHGITTPPTPRQRPGLAASAAFFSSLINPAGFAAWSTVLAMLFATEWLQPHNATTIGFGLGGGIGTALWFGLVIYLLDRYRSRFSALWLSRITRALGAMLLTLAFSVLLRLLAS
jgi:threonine/homoserine/homoserine lactone efflux protein